MVESWLQPIGQVSRGVDWFDCVKEDDEDEEEGERRFGHRLMNLLTTTEIANSKLPPTTRRRRRSDAGDYRRNHDKEENQVGVTGLDDSGWHVICIVNNGQVYTGRGEVVAERERGGSGIYNERLGARLGVALTTRTSGLGVHIVQLVAVGVGSVVSVFRYVNIRVGVCLTGRQIAVHLKGGKLTGALCGSGRCCGAGGV